MPWIHHTIIHVVIGLSLVGPGLAIVRWRRETAWTPEMRLVAYAVAFAAIVAVISGLVSAPHVVERGLGADRVALHRNVAIPTAALLVVTAPLAARGARARRPGIDRATTAVALLAAVLASLAGHFGGDMLHPGLAPWSSEHHTHGPPGDGMPMGSTSVGAHGHDPADHEHGELGHATSAPTPTARASGDAGPHVH